MKRSVSLWQFIGFGFASLFGTLLQFLYEWTGNSLIVAPFSSINESTWEHMKLLFFPMFIFAIFEYFLFEGREDFWCVKLKGTAVGISLIPILFYTYNGVIGKSPDWINIAIFFISAAAAYWLETKWFSKENKKCISSKWSFLILCVIAVAFVVFTFITPPIAIFKDPVSGGYGIYA